MNRNPVLVRNINHLTDARYFAAMNVDWMSIPLDLDPASFSLWHTLKDWVSGVKLAAEINTQDEMLLAKTIIEAAPDGIIFSDSITTTSLPPGIQQFYETQLNDVTGLPEGSSAIITYQAEMLKEDKIFVFKPGKIFLQASWTITSLKALLNAGYAGGICFSSEGEEKTGIKDYEMMDEILGVINP